MAKLTGSQVGQLQELILDAFSQEQFEELLLVKLDIHLDHAIPSDLDWRATGREVVLAAGREGWLADLLRAIAEARPRRKDIQDLIAQLLLVADAATQSKETAPPPTAPKKTPVVEPAPEQLRPPTEQPVAYQPPVTTSISPLSPNLRRWLPVLLGLLAVGVLLGFLLRPKREAEVAVPTATAALEAAAPTNSPQPTATALVEAVVPTNTRRPAPTVTKTFTPTATRAQATVTPSPPPATATVEATATATPTKLPPSATPPARPLPTATRRALLPPGTVTDFETFGTWAPGAQKYGTLTQSSERAQSGKYSARLDYTIPAVADNYVVLQHKPRPLPIQGNPCTLKLNVYGDGSGHFLNAWVSDSKGEVRQFSFGRIEHNGSWQPMTALLDTSAPWPQVHISGPDNGRLDFPISLNALVLDAVGDGPFRGSIYLDDLVTGACATAP